MPSFFSFFFPFFASDTLGSVLLVVLHFHLFLLYFSVIRVIRIECTTLLPYFPTSLLQLVSFQSLKSSHMVVSKNMGWHFHLLLNTVIGIVLDSSGSNPNPCTSIPKT